MKEDYKNHVKLKAVNKFQTEDDSLVTFKELAALPLNTYVDFSEDQDESKMCMRIESNNPDALSFRVIMQEGTFFHPQHHDCTETILVYKGAIVDLNTEKIAIRGAILEFPPFHSHYVKAYAYSEFYVEFKK